MRDFKEFIYFNTKLRPEMEVALIMQKEKGLYRLNSNKPDMKRGRPTKRELTESIKEAQKDPQFIKEINKFIRATTSIHKLR